MIGIKGLQLVYLARIIRHLENAAICHNKAMGRTTEVITDRQWYRDARKEHLELARKYKAKLTGKIYNPRKGSENNV